MSGAAILSSTSQDAFLRSRAQKVIPGGMWGHQRTAAVPHGYPQFFAGGSGAHVRDVDGREYIDFMCSWGPIILGHKHPEVEAAVRTQLDAGDCLDGPTEHAVTLAERLGAALIIDDVRAGFRLNLGGSWEEVGVRPDLAAYSKAIANGHPLAAVTGNTRFREAAEQVFVTGSFWYAGAPMAAAVVVNHVLHQLDDPARLCAAGTRFADGLTESAARHGFDVTLSGPPALPLLQFADDSDATLGEAFCRETLKRGVYLHHKHSMFLSLAHTDSVIDKALQAVDDAFAALARKRIVVA